MLSRATGLQKAREIPLTKKKEGKWCKMLQGSWKGGITNLLLLYGGNHLLQAKYGRKSRNDFYAKRCHYFGKATKFEFWRYLIMFQNPGNVWSYSRNLENALKILYCRSKSRKLAGLHNSIAIHFLKNNLLRK